MDVTWLKLKGFMHMCVIGCGDGPHNPKVVSSSLTPATNEMPLLKQFTEDFLFL